MSKQGFTPGPWSVGVSKKYVVDADGYDLARLDSEADARLVAAAPDLLEALEATLAARSVADSHRALALTKAALAKAKGAVLWRKRHRPASLGGGVMLPSTSVGGEA